MKVSVVIPAYNEELYIGRCIETLLNQNHKDFEIICVDDGSTDKTIKIIENLIKKNKKIKLFKQKHGGPGRGRNLGVKHAKGEIIILVDADMEFPKDFIKKLIKPITDKKAIGTYPVKEYATNIDNIWAKSWGTVRVNEKPGNKGTVFRAILKKEFDRVGGFDPERGTFDDHTLAEKLGKKALGVDVVYYHKNPTSLSETFNQMKWIGGSLIINLKESKDIAKKFGISVSLALVIFIALLAFIGIRCSIWHSILVVILAPVLLSLFLTLRRLVKEFDIRFIYALPIFYLVKILGFLAGALKQGFFAIISKIQKKEVSYRY